MGNPFKWFVVELTEHGDSATYPEIEAALRSIFGIKVEYFIPIHYEQLGSYTSSNTLFEGYIFVKDSHAVQDSLKDLRDSRFFAGLLKSCGKVQKVDSMQIGVLRRRLKSSLKKKLQPGTRVKVTEGIFQNLEGEIRDMENCGKIANVCIKCMSREIIAPIPVTCIEEITAI